MNAQVEMNDTDLLGRLEALLGREHVITDETEREFFSTDIYQAGVMPLAVLRPASAAEVAQVVQ
ncbi:MAG: hydroxyacid dehydrogenase, partial [Steroidobacteraceae bacterium]